MPASIVFNQATIITPGIAGKARSDFVTGQVVTCSNATVESSYTWTLVDVPIRSTLPRGLTATGSTFTFKPDVKGTYLVTLKVNNSALVSDNATSFAAVLSPTRQWRYLAAGEEKIDNLTRAAPLFPPTGVNVRGWATERDLQLEETELAVDAVDNAVVTTPGIGTPDYLVKIDGTTGKIDPTLLPTIPTPPSQGLKYHLVATDNITVATNYQYLISGSLTIDPGAVFTLDVDAELVLI